MELALIPLPDDQKAWIAGVLGAFDEIVRDEMRVTGDGWPVRIVVTRTGDRWWARGFYAFLEHAAVAEVAGNREHALASVDELLHGRPRWSDEPCALVELFDV